MKKHCISYPTESLIFCKLLLFLRIKQEVLIVYSYLCMTTVYIVSFYANITKNGTRSYHCRFTESNPDKKSNFAILKIFQLIVAIGYLSRVLNTIITDEIVMIKIT